MKRRFITLTLPINTNTEVEEFAEILDAIQTRLGATIKSDVTYTVIENGDTTDYRGIQLKKTSPQIDHTN